MKDKIEIEMDDRGSFLLIKIKGELSERTSTYFKNKVLSEIDEHGHLHMVVDCSDCEYINSVGIGILSLIAKRLMDLGGKLGMINPSDAVKDILAISSDFLIIKEYKSLEDAAEDF
jgi:anti-anti-sigma factor